MIDTRLDHCSKTTLTRERLNLELGTPVLISVLNFQRQVKQLEHPNQVGVPRATAPPTATTTRPKHQSRIICGN
jgi:hypothetical protein